MTLGELNPEMRAFVHELAEAQRRNTEEGFLQVRDRYGWAYANGWRSGRNHLADLIDPEVES
jgi:hypothetical protein